MYNSPNVANGIPVDTNGMPHEPYNHMSDERGLSRDEILDRIESHDFKDEMEVANKYLDYAVAMEDMNYPGEAKKFAEMGYEEYTHARCQREMLIQMGRPVSAECETMYRQLHDRLKVLFRR